MSKRGDGLGDSNANFPCDAAGRTYHLQTTKGEIANRLIFVGCLYRAGKIATKYLQQGYFDHTSKRYIRTITGMYKTDKGDLVPVTIVGTGMGFPMTDFAIRECRAKIDGDMCVIRLGSCGCLKEEKDIPLGDICVAKHCVLVTRNPDAFEEGSYERAYNFSRPVEGTPELTKSLLENLKKVCEGKVGVHEGTNGSACSFYSSQGRVLDDFNDKNEKLVDTLIEEVKDIVTLEMETFHIYDLARCAKKKMYCSGAAVTLAQRKSNKFLSMEEKEEREWLMGKAGLETICNFSLEKTMEDGVWNLPTKTNLVDGLKKAFTCFEGINNVLKKKEKKEEKEEKKKPENKE